jgi:hypothetical protein
MRKLGILVWPSQQIKNASLDGQHLYLGDTYTQNSLDDTPNKEAANTATVAGWIASEQYN